MECEICGGEKWEAIYYGPVRDGRGNYVQSTVSECKTCRVWRLEDSQGLENYETVAYRQSLNEPVTASGFLETHDNEQLWKLFALDGEPVRGKKILDIGAGAGSFIDYVRGLARRVVAVEPCREYHKELERKCHAVYPLLDYILMESFDLITCFDTLEHVQDPKKLMSDAFKLLVEGGKMLFATPDRTELFEKRLKRKDYFRTQHKWYFNGESMAHLIFDSGVNKAEYYTEDEPLGQQLYVWCKK